MRWHKLLTSAALTLSMSAGMMLAGDAALSQVDPRQADAAFETLMQPQNAAAPTVEAPDVQPWAHEDAEGREASVELTLERFDAL